MSDQYCLPDLSHLMAGRNRFPANPLTLEPFSIGWSPIPPPQPPYDTTIFASGAGSGFLEMEIGGNRRWPRQETLTLLETRSCLDYKFKAASGNQKGPLWDEVSRIMREEHGYQRSGRKCREKFENLYKYYKKTKEGKGGGGISQDGRQYRFFRQLEALCGDPSNKTLNSSETKKIQTNLVYENVGNLIIDQQKKSEKSWVGEMESIVESHMTKLMERQEAWMEKIFETIENKEEERMSRDEEWRVKESARFAQVYELWTNDRSCAEGRDAVVMEALQEYCSTKEEFKVSMTRMHIDGSNGWLESEISSLIQLRTSMEGKFQKSWHLSEGLWEEVAAKMADLGYDRTGAWCKEIWENTSIYFNKVMH